MGLDTLFRIKAGIVVERGKLTGVLMVTTDNAFGGSNPTRTFDPTYIYFFLGHKVID